MIKIVIIDDEYNIRELLRRLLTLLYKDIEIIGEASSIKEANKIISSSKPDVVILDIELEDGTGFELLDQLDNREFKLIFVTAYNQFAIKAFKYNAVDYLLKPIEPKEFKSTIDKVLTQVFRKNELNELLAHVKKGETFLPKNIVVNTLKEKHIINIDSILYCESDGAYTKIFTKNLSILSSKNLKHHQELLSEHQFIRSHQSFLVNRKAIVSIKSNTLVLSGSIEIPISSRRKSLINTILLK